MARIYMPRQRTDDGRWRMTVSSDEEGWCHAVGYCRPHKALTPTAGYISQEMCDAENARTEPFKHKYHDDGHATEAEAAACYREWELDQDVHKHVFSTTQKKCAECGEWTSHVVEIGLHLVTLCEKHQDREMIKKHAFKREAA